MHVSAPIAPTPSAPVSTGPATAVPSWPSADWHTWEPTHDPHMLRSPIKVMQAAPIAPNARAVAQADFAFGGNFGAHGTLDVFTGATYGRFSDRAAAFAAAQALRGAHGIVGVFRDTDSFAVRELLVSEARHRGPGDDYRDPRPAPRERPSALVALRPVGEPNGSWGHGDFRTLSAVRLVDDALLGVVGSDHRIELPVGL